MSGTPLKEAKKCHVPYRIAHAHSSNQTKDIKYPLKLIFKRSITKNANYLFACGEQAGKWMFNTDNFKVLNNAIDAKHILLTLYLGIVLEKNFIFQMILL